MALSPDCLQLFHTPQERGCDSLFCKEGIQEAEKLVRSAQEKRTRGTEAMNEEAWLTKSAKILSDVKEWRKAHPKATFVEIEDEVHRRMMQLEAHLLQDAAQESASRVWGKEINGTPPTCPTCQVPLQARGQRERTLQGNGGESVTLTRTYGTCPKCGESFFPLDEELALLPGTLAPRQQEHLVRLGSWMPFRHAGQVLHDLLGVFISPETGRRLCEEVGKHVEEQHTYDAKLPWKEEVEEGENTSRMAISADGAMVPLTGGEWAEVRTLAIGEVPAGPADPEKVHVRDLSYFSRLTDAAHFTDLAEVETRRRHLLQAKEVCAVLDGADWLQAFVDIHRQDAVRILDFPHAAEHLGKLLEALSGGEKAFPARRLERCLHILKHRGPDPLVRLADRLTEGESNREEVREHLSYLRKRLALMRYPLFRRAGWPIGSGMVESANKLVVEARLKGSGMRWERTNVNPMLTLCNGVCNERWQETWQTACQQRRAACVQRRHDRAAKLQQARRDALKPDPIASPSPAPSPAPLFPPEPPAMIAGTSRPSSHHPWKRGPSCAPSQFAKI